MQRGSNSSGRRPMTREQYEALRRQRQKQNIISIAILIAVTALVITAVVLILRPSKEKVVNPAAITATVEPAEAATSTPEDQAAAAMQSASEAPTVANAGDGIERSVRMRVVGDIMVCEEQLGYAKTGSTYDFHSQFALISDVLQNADYTMANLETTVGQYDKKKYSGYPLFNSPETLLETLKDDGIDFFTLANNHMLDRWFNGVKNTVGWVEQYGFAHVGAYRTQAERDTPNIQEINGIKIGFVAYTHSTNTQEKVCDVDAVEYGVPYLYKADIAGDIKKLRQAGAEVVIAFPHWGDEYVRTPDSKQKNYAMKLAKAGADIIIGSHSHMVQPMLHYTLKNADGSTRKVFAMFSMGNFISTHTLQYTDSGIVLDFTIKKHADGTISCEDVGYIPTYCWMQNNNVQVLPSGRYLNNPPEGMDTASYERMKASYYETVELIGDKFPVLNG